MFGISQMIGRRRLGRHKGDVSLVMKILITMVIAGLLAYFALSGQYSILFKALDKGLDILSPEHLWALMG